MIHLLVAHVACALPGTRAFCRCCCACRIGASFVLTTLLYVSDTHKRILLWLQLASIVWILVCGVLTTGRFFAALVSGDTALSICPSPGGRPQVCTQSNVAVHAILAPASRAAATHNNALHCTRDPWVLRASGCRGRGPTVLPSGRPLPQAGSKRMPRSRHPHACFALRLAGASLSTPRGRGACRPGVSVAA